MNDAEARTAGRNPAASFLVQAPAGSGKTELLIQRMLALLAQLDEPEEMVALTFTRKAAHEMRERLLLALHAAAEGGTPSDSHKATTHALARRALERDNERGWQLLLQPARLRIMTLDALCAALARQLPLLSGFGSPPSTSDDADLRYRQAVEALLEEHAEGRRDKHLERLLLHLDLQTGRIADLLARMLARREQWLPHLMQHRHDLPGLRAMLEENLALLIEDRLREALALCSPHLKTALPPLARFAGRQLATDDPDHRLAPLTQQEAWPSAELAALPEWQRLLALLLTGDAGKPAWRRKVDKTLGFPAGKEFADAKEAMLALLGDCAGDRELLAALDEVRRLPASERIDAQAWEILQALFAVLHRLAGMLQLVFRRHGEVDFTEVALRALEALGEAERPSEVLLRLDHRIRHLLIDEFQDTSGMQVALIERLTGGWIDGDGRTLFMVGDPMQSIYGFRKAEVGLFLEAGAGRLPLPAVTSLQLNRNFRSAPNIVDWVNAAFPSIFAVHDEPHLGAVRYYPSKAARDGSDRLGAGEVRLHLLDERDDEREAAAMVAAIRAARAADERVGVLARSRSHLHALMRKLLAAGIAHRAVDILPLADRAEVRDLVALTRALMHEADALSWAALLRAPFVGLTLADLHALLYRRNEQTLWQLLHDEALLATLSGDGQLRLQRVRTILAPFKGEVRRAPLRRLLEGAWLQLGAPAVLGAQALANADRYLELVATLEQAGTLELPLLTRRLADLYAAPAGEAEAAQVELLTMHAAKGLQWEVVILPGLGHRPRGDEKPLLAWMEQVNSRERRGTGLLLAPLPAPGESDAAFDLVCRAERRKRELETARLLYVACTRAEKRLLLFGHLVARNEGLQAEKGSLLDLLWRGEQCHGAGIVRLEHEAAQSAPEQEQPLLRRLPASYRLPPPPPSILPEELPLPPQAPQAALEFSWAGVSARAVGIALHAALQQVAEHGCENWSKHEDALAQQAMAARLRAEGLHGEAHVAALRLAEAGLDRALRSERGRWILSARHRESRAEWGLSTSIDGEVRRFVIDRTFIDDAGVRWVIDYKTSRHEGGDPELFLDRELERYTQLSPQLPTYLRLLQALEPQRQVRIGLYFPLLDGWREWIRA